MVTAAGALGLLELGLGRPTEALDRLLLLAGSRHPGIRWVVPDVVEAATRTGQPNTCRPLLQRFERWATGSGLPVPAAAGARCHGLDGARRLRRLPGESPRSEPCVQASTATYPPATASRPTDERRPRAPTAVPP
jgi:hypothetical protein